MNSKIMRVGLLLILLAGIALAALYRDRLDVAALERWIQDVVIWAPLLFMLFTPSRRYCSYQDRC